MLGRPIVNASKDVSLLFLGCGFEGSLQGRGWVYFLVQSLQILANSGWFLTIAYPSILGVKQECRCQNKYISI